MRPISHTDPVTPAGSTANSWSAPLLVLLALGAVAACNAIAIDRVALLQSLNNELATEDSATSVLERWCGDRHLAAESRISAERVSDVDIPANAAVRTELGVAAGEPVRYRHVRLRCGTVVLSEAENWYVPARLTPQMNAVLDSSDEPFGRVVRPLAFRRLRRDAEVLWPPDTGQQRRTTALHELPHTVLRHRALLLLPDGTPFSYLIESYQREALAGR